MLAPEFEVIEPAFRRLILAHVGLRQLFGDGAWTEGPVYVPAGRYLLFSDLPNDRILRWDETNGVISVFRSPCGFANGNTLDHLGRVVTCLHQARSIVRTDHDGVTRTLCSTHASRRLNSPNDVIVKSDGSIWFTDPTYGIDTDYEGDIATPEQPGRYVYRLDDGQTEPVPVATDFSQPNGLAFSPDESHLYVVDSGFSSDPELPRHIRRFSLHPDLTLSGGEVLATCDVGIFDGLRVDIAGNLWVAAGDGVRCYDCSGMLIGRIYVPEAASNLCFGGLKRNRLFITATRSVYTVPLNVRG
ncbi:MAG: SMP-30/gluconolactonase/LRE family protein [Rhizobiales bacterium]|nr:SMP-30/gluconolactonase/LRE family protein [Hyphomicrobiales bacterium]